ncbi:hypothetical protein ACLB2K_007094 [Fragaria x ananassa]
MVDDNETDGIVVLKGYPFCWPVKVKHIRGRGWVELHKGWSDFVKHVIQEESMAYLVIEYEPDMCFTVRAFYSDNNIVLDIPSNKRHLPEDAFLGWVGPGPEYLLKVSSDFDKAMINAHGPFHNKVLVEGVGKFDFILKSMPAVRVEVEKVYFKYEHLSPKSTFITYISWTNSSHFRNLKSDGNFKLLNSETHLNEDPPQDPAPAQNVTGAQNVTDALKSIGAQKE